MDAHLYIFSHWILDSLSNFIADSTESSIKCSLLPKLVHLQEEYENYQRNLQNIHRPIIFPFEASAVALNDQSKIKLSLNQSTDTNNNSNIGINNENNKNNNSENEEDEEEFGSKLSMKKKKEFFVPEIALKTQNDLSYILSSNRLINIPNLRCLAFVLDNNTYCGRANMNHTFHSINLDVAKGLSTYSPNEPKLKDSFIAKTVSIPDSSIVLFSSFYY